MPDRRKGCFYLGDQCAREHAGEAGIGNREELHTWMPPRHKQHHTPDLIGEDALPDTLRRALLSFIIVCAVRKLRGQATEHNSMLVHVTRFTRVQALVYEQISEMLVRIRRRLRFGDEASSNSIKEQMRRIWLDDFVPTTLQMAAFPDAGQLPDWSTVEVTLADVAAGIRVKQINGLAQDVLDYDSHRDQGIDVVVIGGDKLSRGLTLYGLSVSYFSRQSDMYDTLLQMGRWFGYRPGYLDLCRLYTTRILNDAFEHIALASDELRRDFDYMEQIGKRPIDFGLKVRAHPVLKPTAPNKRRHARDIVMYVSYAGTISETKSFSLDPDVLERNKAALDRLVESLRQRRAPESPSYKENGAGQRDYKLSYLWRGVDWEDVRRFLHDYQTEPTAPRANSRLWLSHIQRQIKETGQLSRWNVALMGGEDGHVRNVGGMTVRQRVRKRDREVAQGEGYRIKRLVTPRDAGIDIPPQPWSAARDYDPLDRLSGAPRHEPTVQALCWARQQFGIDPLLMIYLPQTQDFDSSLPPVVGAAISFPGDDRGIQETVRYTANAVYLAESAAEEDAY